VTVNEKVKSQQHEERKERGQRQGTGTFMGGVGSETPNRSLQVGRPESVGTAAEVGLRHYADDCATHMLSVPEVSIMIDNEVLRGRMQGELDVLGLTGEDADRLVQELNFLSCVLIKVTEEGRLNG
jgi:hypothetical protein